jgi:hypothetical protein
VTVLSDQIGLSPERQLGGQPLDGLLPFHRPVYTSSGVLYHSDGQRRPRLMLTRYDQDSALYLDTKVVARGTPSCPNAGIQEDNPNIAVAADLARLRPWLAAG